MESHLTRLRDPTVDYLPGVGEELPFQDDHFDLVIIENCIDHVEDPDLVMSEIRRGLRTDGIAYLTVNCRSRWGYVVHRLLSRFRIDPGHPHTYTANRVRQSLMMSTGFEIVRMNTGQFLDAWLEDLRDPKVRRRLKAVMGVSGYVATVLATPQQQGWTGNRP